MAQCGQTNNMSSAGVDLCSFAVYFKKIKFVCKLYFKDIFALQLQSLGELGNLILIFVDISIDQRND